MCWNVPWSAATIVCHSPSRMSPLLSLESTNPTGKYMALSVSHKQLWRQTVACIVCWTRETAARIGRRKIRHLVFKIPKQFSITLLALERQYLNVVWSSERFHPGQGCTWKHFRGKSSSTSKTYGMGWRLHPSKFSALGIISVLFSRAACFSWNKGSLFLLIDWPIEESL